MPDRIQRNESTPTGQKIWKAVDRGAKKAPQKVLDRLAGNKGKNPQGPPKSQG